MDKLSRLLLLLLPLLLSLQTYSQIGYSPSVDSLICQMSADSLMLYNRQLTGDTAVMVDGILQTIESRHAAFPGNETAAHFIKAKFESFGYDTRYMIYSDTGKNVIASRTGSLYPDKILVLCAHYDNMPPQAMAPGADDNASGVSAMLEIARIVAGTDFAVTVHFIAFDEEEIGFLGSNAYVDSSYYSMVDLVGAINMDMIGWDSNNDDVVGLAANDASVPMYSDMLLALKLYRPEFSAYLMPNFGGSDHYRFWGRLFKAILIEEDRRDFNTHYHTPTDHFDYLNLSYFFRMAQASASLFLSVACDLKMTLSHTQLPSLYFPQTRQAVLTLDTDHPADLENFPPRLYYSVNGQPYQWISFSSHSQGEVFFQLPAFPYGSVIRYYFAVQDTAAHYVCTLPAGGKGINPAGTVPPPECFTFSVMKRNTESYSASGLPYTFPGNDTSFVSIPVQAAGRVLDVNVSLSIAHTNTWDLDLWLVSPSGKQVELSSCNGFIYDHYTSTVFDDEATVPIVEKKAPFTGTFRPEKPLALVDDDGLQGEWKLMVINRGGVSGKVNAYSLSVEYSSGDIYVDASRTVSGDGTCPANALRTIGEACSQQPAPGASVFILPGVYEETINITSNGEEVIPLTTGVGIIAPDVIEFPDNTDLSGIDLQAHPGEYTAYLYRSRIKNSGFYTITGVDDENDLVTVDGILLESAPGSAGDTNSLCCAIGRPVVYSRYPFGTGQGNVVVIPPANDSADAVVYVGDPVGTGEYDAIPASYNLLRGLDITGATAGCGVKIQSSSFNIILDNRIHDVGGTGMFLDGNQEHPALCNFIIGNLLYDTPPVGIRIGYEGLPASQNQTAYNHLISNVVFSSDEGFASAISIASHNKGNSLRDNVLKDLYLVGDTVAVIEIRSHADYTLVSANHIRNITGGGTGINSMLRLAHNNFKVDIFNNSFSDSVGAMTGLYAFHLDGSGTDSCRVVHNTIYQVDKGFLLEDHAEFTDFDIQNNIIEISEDYFDHEGLQGRFHVAYNLYNEDPTPDTLMPYSDEEGRQLGTVTFEDALNGNFHLVVPSEPAICNGAPLYPAVPVDPERTPRFSDAPDIGAFELDRKKVWLGTASSDWSDPSNWDGQCLPDVSSNVVVEAEGYFPDLPQGTVQVHGLLVKEGASVHLSSGSVLIILEN